MKINKIDMLLGSIERLYRRNAVPHIKRLLLKSHPSEIAAVVRQVSDDLGIQIMLWIKGSELEPTTFVELESPFLQKYFQQTEDKDHVAEVLQKLPEDEAAALLADFNENDRQSLLSLMQVAVQEEVKEILQYGEDTCGRIMAVNVFALNQSLTAKEAIAEIQNSSNQESLFYIYTIDEFDNLVGVVSTRQILQVGSERRLKDFMSRDVIRVNVYDSQERAANFVEEYNFVSLPVVDDEGKLVGMVTVDDVIDYIRDEAHEEVLQMAGVEPEGIDNFSYITAFLSRTIWYGLLFLGGVLCSEIVNRFLSLPFSAAVYFCFAPLVLRLGGSSAIQSMTFMNQGWLSNDIEKSRAAKALWGQNTITFLVALLLAFMVTMYVYFRFMESLNLAAGLGVALVTVTFLSILVGIFVPWVFHKLKFDAQQASSRFIHFLMDAISLGMYFYTVSLWQQFFPCDMSILIK